MSLSKHIPADFGLSLAITLLASVILRQMARRNYLERPGQLLGFRRSADCAQDVGTQEAGLTRPEAVNSSPLDSVALVDGSTVSSTIRRFRSVAGTSGCFKQFIRIRKESLLRIRTFDTIDEPIPALHALRETCEITRLIIRLGLMGPAAFRRLQLQATA